ncbi:hypothetical protein KO504_14010 [Winogradskyella psychrotolerans]|uniref:hypothetical protein n=1 Tax=Winogradskyella psychrotolerans TaxID=1344585 RepID=UPI001C07DE41|nr:hypothetical protein [Winogradskyella psychrotolerans]MBU2922459.1 hypothetical protein [Winogradskyella psychrotolerans]
MMNKTSINVLTIDDHISIIEAFENSLNLIANQSDAISFKTNGATDCESAYLKIEEFAKT